jgi:hypothetical protein
MVAIGDILAIMCLVWHVVSLCAARVRVARVGQIWQLAMDGRFAVVVP